MTQGGFAVFDEDADGRAAAALTGVAGVFRNQTNWYHNASFLLPLAATVLVGAVGAATRNHELLGFAAFLAVVTAGMLPIVLLTWRQTATAVVLSEDGITTLHRGRLLKSLTWSAVQTIQRRETQGNVRWAIAADSGERILLDGEIENLPALLQLAHDLSGVDLDEQA